jgi:hypothetical protein
MEPYHHYRQAFWAFLTDSANAKYEIEGQLYCRVWDLRMHLYGLISDQHAKQIAYGREQRNIARRQDKTRKPIDIERRMRRGKGHIFTQLLGSAPGRLDFIRDGRRLVYVRPINPLQTTLTRRLS